MMTVWSSAHCRQHSVQTHIDMFYLLAFDKASYRCRPIAALVASIRRAVPSLAASDCGEAPSLVASGCGAAVPSLVASVVVERPHYWLHLVVEPLSHQWLHLVVERPNQ